MFTPSYVSNDNSFLHICELNLFAESYYTALVISSFLCLIYIPNLWTSIPVFPSQNKYYEVARRHKDCVHSEHRKSPLCVKRPLRGCHLKSDRNVREVNYIVHKVQLLLSGRKLLLNMSQQGHSFLYFIYLSLITAFPVWWPGKWIAPL
jgi:hypothetical protein